MRFNFVTGICVFVLLMTVATTVFAAEDSASLQSESTQVSLDTQVSLEMANDGCGTMDSHGSCCFALLTHCNVFPPLIIEHAAFDNSALSASRRTSDDGFYKQRIVDMDTPPPRG